MIVRILEPKSKDSLVRLTSYLQREGVSQESKDQVASLVRYMTRDQDFPAQATHCGCEPQDIGAALEVMKSTQAMNTRAKEKTVHLMVSFSAGEIPPQDQLNHIEERLAISLDLKNHQRIRVIHTDTDHFHMHVAINRIHPVTHRSIQMTGDHHSLSRCAQQLEIELGLEQVHGRDPARAQVLEAERRLVEKTSQILACLEPSDDWESFLDAVKEHGVGIAPKGQGVVFAEIDTGLSIAGSRLDRSLSKHFLEERLGPIEALSKQRYADLTHSPPRQYPETTLSDEAIKRERHQGRASFQRRLLEQKEQVLPILQEADDWQTIHQSLHALDLELVKWRQGLVMRNPQGQGTLGVSKLDREVSLRQLEERLGPFEPNQHVIEQDHVSAWDQEHSPLWDDYESYRREAKAKRQQWYDRQQHRRQREAKGIQTRFEREARRIQHSLFLRGWNKKQAYKRLAKRRREAYKQLPSIRDPQRPVVLGWRDWLQEQASQGHQASIEQLQRIAQRQQEKVGWEKAAVGVIEWDDDEDNPSPRQGSQRVRRDGRQAITVSGVEFLQRDNRIVCLSDEEDDLKTVLRHAQQQTDGLLRVHGTDDFLQTVEQVAHTQSQLTIDPSLALPGGMSTHKPTQEKSSEIGHDSDELEHELT